MSGIVPIAFDALGADLLSVSAHMTPSLSASRSLSALTLAIIRRAVARGAGQPLRRHGLAGPPLDDLHGAVAEVFFKVPEL